MYCAKKEKRNLFGILKEYDCRNCPYFLNDEEIKIGYKSIKIYYLVNECIYNKKEIIYNKKSKLIFKDIYIDQTINRNDNNIFLWLDKNDKLNRYYDIFNYFLNNNYNIFIII